MAKPPKKTPSPRKRSKKAAEPLLTPNIAEAAKKIMETHAETFRKLAESEKADAEAPKLYSFSRPRRRQR